MIIESNTLRRAVVSTLTILAFSTSASAIAQAPAEADLAAPTLSPVSEDAAATLAAPAETAAQPSSADSEAAPALFASGAVGDEMLASITGREQSGAMIANAKNTSNVSENHVGDNSTTGDVNVADSAFQNVSGIAMVNFNTGNNSSMNAAMSVNIQINYAAPTAP